MTLALLTVLDVADRLKAKVGDALDSVEAVAELIRGEVHARGLVSRAAVLERVSRTLAPVAAVEASLLISVCDALTGLGDLVRAPGGILGATPLRAVRLGDHVRLVGSVPSHALETLAGTGVSRRGATRFCSWNDEFPNAVTNVGGRMITREVWTGLEWSPKADQAFLDGLDERLRWESAQPGSLERDLPLDWRGWHVTDGEARWVRGEEHAQLWSARAAWGGYVSAWTSGEGPPSTHALVKLTADDASRARFALCRKAAKPPKLLLTPALDHVVVAVPAWLPRPEYRWLSLHAEYVGMADRVALWRSRAVDVRALTEMLTDRLGIHVEGT